MWHYDKQNCLAFKLSRIMEVLENLKVAILGALSMTLSIELVSVCTWVCTMYFTAVSWRLLCKLSRRLHEDSILTTVIIGIHILTNKRWRKMECSSRLKLFAIWIVFVVANREANFSHYSIANDNKPGIFHW